MNHAHTRPSGHLPAGALYGARLAHGEATRRAPSNFPPSNAPGAVVPEPVFDVAALISEEQRAFFRSNFETTRDPTRFDVQNTMLKIGGSPLPMHRTALSRLAGTTDTSFTVPFTPNPSPSAMYGNPLVFDYGSAVRSSHPPVLSHESESLERMMRDVSEVDPALVTNPIPDPTFMARQPMFDAAPEAVEMARRRLERSTGPNRFW